jgi:transcriptional regulator of acetoin/glycerol metabolism
LGADRSIKVDLRVVCASHQNLRAMIAFGQFREDLYYRLNGFTLELPSLAERLDKDELIRSMIAAGSEDGRPLSLEPEAFRALSDYGWPGNIRELRNVIRTAAAICEGSLIRALDLPSEVRQASKRGVSAESAPNLKPIEAAERRALLDAIEETHGNMLRAAQLLGISRSSLYRRCKELKISVSDRPPRH